VKETLERVAEAAGALARSFRDLSSGRKAAVLVAAVLVAGTASAVLFPGASGSPRRVLSDPSGDQEKAAAPERPERSPFESASLFDTPGRVLGKQREYNREKIEQAIGLNRNIARAHIVLSHAPPGAGGEDSAAVSIHLQPGVPELLPQEAEAIRGMVSSAFNLKPERVSITDDRLHEYNDRSGTAALAGAERRQKEIAAVITERYARLFAPGEFHVSVIVQLSSRQSSVVKEDVHPDPVSGPRRTRIEREECPAVDPGADGGIGSPGSPWRRYRETNEEEIRFGSEKTLTEIPPGELEGVSASVLIDLAAVERHLRKEGLLRPSPDRDGDLSLAMLPPAEREILLKDFAGRQEDALRSLLQPLRSEPIVKVMVLPFERAPAPAAAPQLAGLAPSPETPGSWPAGAVFAVAAAAIVLAWTLLAIRQRRVPRAADLAGEWAGREAVRDGTRARHAARASLGGGLLGSVGDASALVRERPEVAALVLRSWLAQDGEGVKEVAKR
jgi:hypothetical protein